MWIVKEILTFIFCVITLWTVIFFAYKKDMEDDENYEIDKFTMFVLTIFVVMSGYAIIWLLS